MTRMLRQIEAPTGRLAALALRHAALEAAIGREQARPVPDMGALQMLKRKRFALKEQMHRLGKIGLPQAAG